MAYRWMTTPSLFLTHLVDKADAFDCNTALCGVDGIRWEPTKLGELHRCGICKELLTALTGRSASR